MGLSYEEYRVLSEQAPIMIWRAGTDGLCDYFNQRWLDFTGRPLALELGDGWTEGVFPEDYQACLEIYRASFSRRESFEMRYRLRRADGQYRWIFDRGVPFYSDNDSAPGGFGGYIGSCIDVSEQVTASEYLEAQRERELDELRGLLPICSYCKSIRDDKGDWHRLEEYIKCHTKTDFTHGICPECRKKYFGQSG